MKKLFIVNILMLCAIVTYAQLSKGTIQIGGQVNYSRTSNDNEILITLGDTKSSTFTISPRAGIFVSDKSVIGLSIEYSRNTSEGIYSPDFGFVDVKGTSNTFIFGPYYRFYQPLGTTAALFLHAQSSVGFGKNKTEIDDTDIRFKSFLFNVAVSPGITFFVSEKWGLEGSIGLLSYRSTTMKLDEDDADDDKDTSDQFDFNLNFSSFSLGVQYFLAR
jgi:hypothetical protein